MDHRFRITTASIIGALLVGIPTRAALARHSFPIEVTGAIISFNRASHTFTIRADEPAKVLAISVGQECKFKQNGTIANEHIMRRGARVKVSYFATIFTGNIAVEIDVNSTLQFATGIIENVDVSDRRLVLSEPDSRHLTLHWATDASFIRAGKPTSAAALRVTSIAQVAYYAPAFATKYAVKIDLK